MSSTLLQAIATAIVALLSAIITLAVTHWSKRREELFARKREMYDKLLRPYVAVFHEILAEKHNVRPLTQKKVGDILELSFLLPLYVPDRVFRAFQLVQRHANELQSSSEKNREKIATEFYLSLGDLLLEIRKDLGYKRTSLKGIDIIRNMIRDIDEFAKKHDLRCD